MSTILETIVEHKKLEVEKLEKEKSIASLEKEVHYQRKVISFAEALSDPKSSGVISEFKRKSPSKGWIHQDAIVADIVGAYQEAGVAAISCLTDEHFFGASKTDFIEARNVFQGPMLRKDFIISPYQVYQSKAMGADVILLIAAILTKQQVIEFTDLAHELGLEVLLELHHNNELEKYYEEVDVVGINNRDLTDFTVSLLTSIDMKRKLPENALKISESGLDHPGIVCDLYRYGFRGFLIGEHFMKHNDPGKTAGLFVKDLQKRKGVA